MTGIDSPVSGSVWRLLVAQGDRVAAGDAVMILESMKMEIEIHATRAGGVSKILNNKEIGHGRTNLAVAE